MRREWWLGPGRYLLASAALVVLFLQHAWTDAWGGDFWIYVAAVDEIQANPWQPGHPLFGGSRAFAFASPYTWLLGMLGRATGLRAFEVFVLQGFVNLVVLLTAIYAFASTWLRRNAAAFYALLFILFLWGADPWLFSSFFHFRSLALVLPYPSTLAAALALAGLAGFRLAMDQGKDLAWAALLMPLGAFLWIVHPVNGLFLCLGLVACSLEARRPLNHWLLLGAALGGGLAVALLWPLFPVEQLWFQGAGQVHRGNDAMYDHPLPRIAPALLGLPFLFARLRRNVRDPLALLGLALGALVVIGGLTGASTLGRLISHAVLVLQVVLAGVAARVEERIGRLRLGAVARPAFATAAVVLLLAYAWPNAVKPTLDESWRGDPLWLGFLGGHVARQDVVMADLDDSWFVPAFGGKVVAYPMPLPFAPDHDERVRAVSRFFGGEVKADERREIIRRYGVSYVLLARWRSQASPAPMAQLRTVGPLVYASPDYELRRVDPFPRR